MFGLPGFKTASRCQRELKYNVKAVTLYDSTDFVFQSNEVWSRGFGICPSQRRIGKTHRSYTLYSYTPQFWQVISASQHWPSAR